MNRHGTRKCSYEYVPLSLLENIVAIIRTTTTMRVYLQHFNFGDVDSTLFETS